jgi:hypothetical protein
MCHVSPKPYRCYDCDELISDTIPLTFLLVDLEKPDETADAIAAFMQDKLRQSTDTTKYVVGGLAGAGAAVAATAFNVL